MRFKKLNSLSRLLLVLVFLAVMLGTPAVLPARAAAGDAVLVLGQPDFIHSTAGLSATTMASPYAVAFDPTTGKVFVADPNNNRVLRFASYSALSNGAAAEGVLGQVDFTSNVNAGIFLAANTLVAPAGVAVDASGRLWVTDNGNARVLRFDAAASKSNGANADGVLGQPDFTSGTPNRGGTLTANTLNNPFGLVIQNGQLWVSDAGNNRVLRFDNAAGKANGASADGVLGQADFTSNIISVSANTMYSPFGITLDQTGRLWVVDYNQNRVLRFDAAAGKPNGANADGVLGQADFTHRLPNRGGSVAADTLYSPFGIAVDSAGRLWVADTWNNRMLRFDAAAGKPNGANADGVLGQADFTSGNANGGGGAAGVAANTLWGPAEVAVDASDRLWVADSANNRVLVFVPFPLSFNVFLPLVFKN